VRDRPDLLPAGIDLRTKRYLTAFALFTLILLIVIWYLLPPQDQITLVSQTGSDSATVLLDGWRTACDVDDEVHRGSGRVGNMQPGTSCTSEVAVFAIDNAMQLVTPVTVWTNASTDVVTVPMTTPLNVPLTAWVLTGIAADPVVNASRADAVYNSMQAGISFHNVDVRDYHTQTAITVAACERLETLKTAYPPVASRVNAYYVQTVTTDITAANGATVPTSVPGKWCEGTNPAIILMGAWYTETLAHELGHAFSLQHSDSWAASSSSSATNDNLMLSSSISRSKLTIGQAFRVNVHNTSWLKQNSLGTALARSCPDSQTPTARCPAISFDVQPK